MSRHNLFTSNSKKNTGTFCFFAKLGCVFLALFLFFGKIIMPQYLYSYNAALLDKMERLESIKEPKIVLIGNSNLTFGIKSELLEKAFGMPVVNMGLHGSLGNSFHEEMAKVNVREGDIIIIAHTEFADRDTISDPVIAWLTLENHPGLWKLLRTKDIPDMYFAFPDYAKRALTLWLSKEGNEQNYGDVYSRLAFNEYGDIAFERQSSQLDVDTFFTSDRVAVPTINDTCVNRLNKLNQYVTERGATLLIAAYPIADVAVTPPAQDYIAFQEKLQESLDCPVISDYTDYFIDGSYFYDHFYHLTDEGAVLRTNQLIQDLQQWMASSQE
ncbi:MAG: hypothetical protein PUD93_08215 [Lachnospiraceae bacterium]|nr:hypothetical protein [Lachnospiraceae bacterium]